MKTLATPDDRTEIIHRIRLLTPDATRQWGTMSVAGMICHLDDAFRVTLGEMAVESMKIPIPRSVAKAVALNTPTHWPKNVMSPKEICQGTGGTLPGDFTADRKRLLESLERFCLCQKLAQIKHPIFGPMSHSEWMRWGYLHTDHHLRQFGI